MALTEFSDTKQIWEYGVFLLLLFNPAIWGVGHDEFVVSDFHNYAPKYIPFPKVSLLSFGCFSKILHIPIPWKNI